MLLGVENKTATLRHKTAKGPSVRFYPNNAAALQTSALAGILAASAAHRGT